MKKIGNGMKTLSCVVGTIFCVGQAANICIQELEHARYARLRKTRRLRREARHMAGKAVSRKRRIAIITGASSGLGAEYARQLCEWRRKFGVDEIWLIARRIDRLEVVAEHLDVAVKVLALDLTDEDDRKLLSSELEREKRADVNFQVNMLIKCAGRGVAGRSQKLGIKTQTSMIDLNAKAAVAVTTMVVPYMKAGARIIEVCSIASFFPIPFFNVYSATKSMLYSYARALRVELMSKGISVTAVCPYWIHDTEFEGNGSEFQYPKLSSTASRVAKWSLLDAKRDKAVSTPNIVSKMGYFARKLIPNSVMGYLLAVAGVVKR